MLGVRLEQSWTHGRGDTPLWKLEAPLKGRSCRTGRHPCSAVIKRVITPYKWVHPEVERSPRAEMEAVGGDGMAAPRQSMLDALASAVEWVSRKLAARFVARFGLPTGCCA